MSLEHLVGSTYGPVEHRISTERVADFVAATGDGASRWTDVAPPSYAGALLFVVAPLFLNSPAVGDASRVLIHLDQKFRYHVPLKAEETVTVAGQVTNVRLRRGLNFVSYLSTVKSGSNALVTSESTFLMGSEPAGLAERERVEPPVHAAASDDTPEKLDLSTDAQLNKSASRLRLVRYAAASGDFNPIHWDHAAARGAGLEGIVVHGLLMGAWMSQVAAATSDRQDPIEELKLRFRKPLYPADAATVAAEEVGSEGAEMRLVLRCDGTDHVTGTARLRR